MKVVQIQLFRVLLIQLAVCSLNCFFGARLLLPNEFSILTRVNKGCASSCRDEDKQIYLNHNCVVNSWRFESGTFIGNILEDAILGIMNRPALLRLLQPGFLTAINI